MLKNYGGMAIFVMFCDESRTKHESEAELEAEILGAKQLADEYEVAMVNHDQRETAGIVN